MDIKIQRKIDRWIGSVVCYLFSLFSRNDKGPRAPEQVEKVLVILLSEMGSLILGYPMFQRIRQNYPNATLYGLVFKKNREVLNLLKVTSQENVLTLDDSSLWTFAIDSVGAIRRMRQLKMDVVIDCELFARISSIFSFLSGAVIRAGFHRHTQEGLYRGSFINRPVLYNPYRHISRQFLTLVDAIASDTHPKAKDSDEDDIEGLPTIKFDPLEVAAMQTQLYGDYPTLKGSKIVLLYPGGGLLPIRAWPLPYYNELAKTLLNRGFAVGIIGLAADKNIAHAILQECRHPACVDLTGYTKTIHELMLIFQFTDLLITNDGGPVHFAALTDLPSIIFFGPETPLLYRPFNDKATVFYKQIACSPCLTAYNHRNSPCDGDNVCLKRISPEMVIAKALEILRTPNEKKNQDT
jgi:ADP-heptose:LPS heptosyltransferase